MSEIDQKQMTREERRRLRKERREKRDSERQDSGTENTVSTSSSSLSLSPNSPLSPQSPDVTESAEPSKSLPTSEDFESGKFSFTVVKEEDNDHNASEVNRTVLDHDAYKSYSQHIRRASGASSQHVLEATKNLFNQAAENTPKHTDPETELLQASETTVSHRREQFRQQAEDSKPVEHSSEKEEIVTVPVKEITNQYITMATAEHQHSETEKPEIHVNLEEAKTSLTQHGVTTKKYIEDEEEMLSQPGSGLSERTQKLFSYAEGNRDEEEGTPPANPEEEEVVRPADSLSNIKQKYMKATSTDTTAKSVDVELDLLATTSLRDRTNQFQSNVAKAAEKEEKDEEDGMRPRSPLKNVKEQFLTAAQSSDTVKFEDDELAGLRRSGSVRGAKKGLEENKIQTKRYTDPQLEALSGTVSQTAQGWGKNVDNNENKKHQDEDLTTIHTSVSQTAQGWGKNVNNENKKHQDEDLTTIHTSVSQVKSQYGKTETKAKKYIEDDEDLQMISGRVSETAKESLYKSEKKPTKYIEQDEALQHISVKVGEAKESLYKPASKTKKYIEDEEDLSSISGTVKGTKETFAKATPTKSKKYIEEDEDIQIARGTVSSSMQRLKATTDETKKYNPESEELSKIRSPVSQRKQMFLQSCAERKTYQKETELEGIPRSGSVKGAKQELQQSVVKTKKYVEEDEDLQGISSHLSEKLESLQSSHKPTHKYIEDEETLGKLSEYVQETQEDQDYREPSKYMEADPELANLGASVKNTKESLIDSANKPVTKRYIDEDETLAESKGHVTSSKSSLTVTSSATKKYIEEDPDLVPGQVKTTMRSLSDESSKGYKRYVDEDEALHMMSPGKVSGDVNGHHTEVDNGVSE